MIGQTCCYSCSTFVFVKNVVRDASLIIAPNLSYIFHHCQSVLKRLSPRKEGSRVSFSVEGIRDWLIMICRWDPPSSLEIAGYLPSGSGVGHEDIIIVVLKINLTAGNTNPLEKVSFFDSYGSNKKRGLRESDMTALSLQNNEVSRPELTLLWPVPMILTLYIVSLSL